MSLATMGNNWLFFPPSTPLQFSRGRLFVSCGDTVKSVRLAWFFLKSCVAKKADFLISNLKSEIQNLKFQI
jgi:hypothetical protein